MPPLISDMFNPPILFVPETFSVLNVLERSHLDLKRATNQVQSSPRVRNATTARCCPSSVRVRGETAWLANALNLDRSTHHLKHFHSSDTTAVDCESCPIAGSFCRDPGQDRPSGLCSAGFYCGSGATTDSPDSGSETGYQGDTCVDRSNGAINDVCPPGHYCPEGAMGSQSPIKMMVRCSQSPHINMAPVQ